MIIIASKEPKMRSGRGNVASMTRVLTVIMYWMVYSKYVPAVSGQTLLNARFTNYMETIENMDRNLLDLKNAMLQHTGLHDVPSISPEERNNFQIPTHVKKQYEELRMQHEKRHRTKRSSLANLFGSVHANPGIPGDIVYSDPYIENLQFEMDGRIPRGTVVTMAELRLFKKVADLEKLRWIGRRQGRRYRNLHPSVFLRNHPGRFMKPVRHARVSIYHNLFNPDGTVKSTLVDSRKIHVNGSGWQAFDVTNAVHQWQLHPTRMMTMTLEMWIEGTRPTRHAANIAKLVRFTGQNERLRGQGYRPELVVFTREERASRLRECRPNSNPKRRKCCRDNHYVSFRDIEWTKLWILEPAGYEAFRCDGKCSASRRKGFSRSCSVAESAPLPVMYMIKRDDVTSVEVTEFPNMIVTRCGCSLDSVFLSS